MNEISIIINGVRYDTVECKCDVNSVCKECDLAEYCDNMKSSATFTTTPNY